MIRSRRALFRHPTVDRRDVHDIAGMDRAVVVTQVGQMMRRWPNNICVPSLTRGRWRVATIHPTEPVVTRSMLERDAMLYGELAVAAHELATVGLPLPVLKPELGMVIELAAERAMRPPRPFMCRGSSKAAGPYFTHFRCQARVDPDRLFSIDRTTPGADVQAHHKAGRVPIGTVLRCAQIQDRIV